MGEDQGPWSLAFPGMPDFQAWCGIYITRWLLARWLSQVAGELGQEAGWGRGGRLSPCLSQNQPPATAVCLALASPTAWTLIRAPSELCLLPSVSPTPALGSGRAASAGGGL